TGRLVREFEIALDARRTWLARARKPTGATCGRPIGRVSGRTTIPESSVCDVLARVSRHVVTPLLRAHIQREGAPGWQLGDGEKGGSEWLTTSIPPVSSTRINPR